MFRDPTKLRVFGLADELALDLHRLAAALPGEARASLGAPLARAATAAPLQIQEACRGGDDRFRLGLEGAIGAATEARYLASLLHRLGHLPQAEWTRLEDRLTHLVKACFGLRKAQGRPRSGTPEAAEEP
ncbi:MAG: four helix bundle protein [Acidobacteria bacterium]|nr:four helix bundle protein [Acidobacteriota bacterium]